ncbi:MAG: ATP:cob(I)alamin adenosyltransferase [Dehalococcoidia bacterium]|nr:ATP:cob(I)alamin adenosyltransferase [Dehalococcoidia bacterium]
MAKLYTRNGDNGETFLLFGEKVSKNDLRVECYGAIDECMSYLGAAKSSIQKQKDKDIEDLIINIQRKLFIISSEIACPKNKYQEMKKKYKYITEAMIQEVEDKIDYFQKNTPEIKFFVLPGSTLESSFIDISRTICRKAERLCVKVKDKDLLNNDLNLILLNRLSDLLFILARYIDKEKEYIKASE